MALPALLKDCLERASWNGPIPRSRFHAGFSVSFCSGSRGQAVLVIIFIDRGEQVLQCAAFGHHGPQNQDSLAVL